MQLKIFLFRYVKSSLICLNDSFLNQAVTSKFDIPSQLFSDSSYLYPQIDSIYMFVLFLGVWTEMNEVLFHLQCSVSLTSSGFVSTVSEQTHKAIS